MPPVRASLVPIAAAAAVAAVCLAGCASPTLVGSADGGLTAVPATAAAAPPCPPPSRWESAPAPTQVASTPANTPQAEALSQAVGAQGRGAFADVYGSQVTDYPVGRVALCVTDPARGRQLAAAAKKADPSIDLDRLDLYRCRYSARTLDAAVDRIMAAGPRVLGFPLYTASPVQDASGITVTTTAAGARSAALRAALARTAGSGVPVTVLPGTPLTGAG